MTTPQPPMNDLHLHTNSRDGHRGAYLDFARTQLGGQSCDANVTLTARGAVLFLMADDGFHRYAITALLRMLLGRRTAGLLFRPGPALDADSLRLRFKRGLLKLLRVMPRVVTLTILPFPLRPDFATIADGWIHDFQLWDMTKADHSVVEALRAGDACPDTEAAAFYQAIMQSAEGRPVLVALGMQSRGKGFVRLAAVANALVEQGWQIVVAGRIDPALAAEKAALQELGVMIADRFISDGEILAAYGAASAVWCCYDPAYDQASGILGRAVQFGCPAVVRAGSLSEALCRQEARPFLAVSGAINDPVDMSALPAPDVLGGRQVASQFRRRSLAVLRDALNLAPPGDAAPKREHRDG